MSQPEPNGDKNNVDKNNVNKNKNYFRHVSNKPPFKRGNGWGRPRRRFYPQQYHYNKNNEQFQPPPFPWNFYCWPGHPMGHPYQMWPPNTPPEPETELQKTTSPFTGTEEYTKMKIQETSDMIKKKLMMPPEETDSSVNTDSQETNSINGKKTEKLAPGSNKNNNSEKSGTKPSNNKKPVHYNVEEIHKKIINHITNLNHGRKRNLICGHSSGYDIAIQQIQKQKRLELSKVLRDMCANQSVDNSEAFNSIVPDIGIKIEDLPLEVIQQLSNTLDLNFDDSAFPQFDDFDSADSQVQPQDQSNANVEIKTEICTETDEPSLSSFQIEETLKFEDNDEELDKFLKGLDEEFKTPEMEVTVSTNNITTNSISTQTDNDLMSDKWLFKKNPDNLNDAIKTMLEIDKEIAKLTTIRQSIFLQLQTKETTQKNGFITSKKIKDEEPSLDVASVDDIEMTEKDILFYDRELNFKHLGEKIMVVKVVDNVLLAGSESGKLFYLSLEDGATLRTIQVNFTITSLVTWSPLKNDLYFFISSMDSFVRKYKFDSGELVTTTETGEGVLCMELSWDFIFMGTGLGKLKRYSVKKQKITFEEKISVDRILVIKATQEGARRVLLVGTKDQPVCVRDAMSGLHMRTMTSLITPAVYSLLLENSLVYCGTPFNDVLVYSFHDGTLLRKYQATKSKGVGCLKIVDSLLFASCHDGNVYVYNTKERQYVGQINGPGGMILTMEVVKNIVIVGTISCNFKSILIPDYILESNRSV